MQTAYQSFCKKQEKKIVEYNVYKKIQQIDICCAQTIESHIQKNAMMSCSSCKGIIKSFIDKSNYLNYLGVKFLETLVLSATLMS